MASKQVYFTRLKRNFPYESIQQAILRAANELGYSSPKPGQAQVVANLISGRDVFLTGGAKYTLVEASP